MSGRKNPLRVLLAGVSWRTIGSRRAGETLLEALSGDDEQNRMLAGMSLVKAGQRTVGLIAEKVSSGTATPSDIRLLPDLESPRARALLASLADHGPAELSQTARHCLDQLKRMSPLQD